MTGKQLMFGIVAIALVGLGLAAYFVMWGGSSDDDMTDLPRYTMTISPTDHTLGNPNAPVQVVEYAAPSCPVCARWDMTIFPSFKPAYVDTGKVFYVFRVFPLRSLDLAVEAVARCLPQSDYFHFIDMMYRNQQKWDPDGYDIPDVHGALIAMSKQGGLSAEKAEACSNNQDELKKAGAIGEYAGKTYNINSTPSFIVNGRFRQQEMMTWDSVKDLIDSEVKRKMNQ